MTQTALKPQPHGFAILESALRSVYIIIKIGTALWTAEQLGVFKMLGF